MTFETLNDEIVCNGFRRFQKASQSHTLGSVDVNGLFSRLNDVIREKRRVRDADLDPILREIAKDASMTVSRKEALLLLRCCGK